MKSTVLLVLFAVLCGSAFADEDGQYSTKAIQGRRDYYAAQAKKYQDAIDNGDNSKDMQAALKNATDHRDQSQMLLNDMNEPSSQTQTADN